MDSLEKYRKKPVLRAYKISKVDGHPAPWRVEFNVDGIMVGGGQYQSYDQAEDAGVDFMFSGAGVDD